MQGLALPDVPSDLSKYIASCGECVISGELFDLGRYPGLVPGTGNVRGELYRLNDPLPKERALEAFRQLDEYERYDAHDVEGSLYHRRVVRLRNPTVDAWLYYYNGPVDGARRIESGDWRDYRAEVP